MTGESLTTKELASVEECIKAEVLCCVKLEGYAREAQEPELRELCRHGIQSAERHVEQLLSLIR